MPRRMRSPTRKQPSGGGGEGATQKGSKCSGKRNSPFSAWMAVLVTSFFLIRRNLEFQRSHCIRPLALLLLQATLHPAFTSRTLFWTEHEFFSTPRSQRVNIIRLNTIINLNRLMHYYCDYATYSIKTAITCLAFYLLLEVQLLNRAGVDKLIYRARYGESVTSFSPTRSALQSEKCFRCGTPFGCDSCPIGIALWHRSI